MIWEADQFLLNRIEKICHKIQIYTGINNFQLARLFIFFSTIFCFYYAKLITTFIVLVYFGFIVVVSVIVENYCISNKNFINPLRIILFAGRLFVFITMLIVVIKYQDTYKSMDFIFGLLCFYVISCTPLQPTDTKIGNFFKSLLQNQRPVTNES